jgi:protein SCO1/2
VNWVATFARPLLIMLSISLHASAASTTGVELKADPSKVPVEMQDVGVSEHLGQPIDLNLTFTSDGGQVLPLRQMIDSKKPTIVNLVYFECPMLCTMVLNGVTDGMKGLDWTVGNQFNVLTVSIDPKDGAEQSKAKKATYIDHYVSGKPELQNAAARAVIEKNWTFATGTQENINALADQLGFRFKYDKQQGDFAHPAVTFMITPAGMVSRYLYGIQYRPRDLRLGLLEASQGKIGSVFDRFLMFCYHYDPTSRGYSIQVIQLMKVGGAATIGLLGGWLLVFWTRQRKGKKANDIAPA